MLTMGLVDTSGQPHRWRSLAYPRSVERGFTLFELLLVMAIIVVIAALAAPAINRSFQRHALNKAADQVRVAMGQARVRAIREGEVHAVFFQPGESWLNVAPFSQIGQQTALSRQRVAVSQEKRQSDLEDALLPPGVIFATGETANDARSLDVIGNAASSNAIQPILFYPDGSSQDARVLLQNEKNSLIEIQLRGLTGVATKVRVDSRSANR